MLINLKNNFVLSLMLVIVLSLSVVADAKTNGLSLALTYQKQMDFVEDDEQRVLLLNGILSQQNIEFADVTIALQGSQARLSWEQETESTFAKPSEKAMKMLRKSMPEMAEFYDNHAEMKVHKKERLIWDAIAGQQLRVVSSRTQAFDIASKSVKTTTKTKQKLNQFRPQYCESLRTHDFQFPRLESPCQTHKWLDKEYRVATGRKETISLLVKNAIDKDFELKSIQCEYYGISSSRQDVSLGAKLSGTCISFINELPIIIIEESRGMQEAKMDAQSVVRYELRKLDLFPEFQPDYFNFEINSPCGKSRLSEGSKRC